jgi:hypothetical protein
MTVRRRRGPIARTIENLCVELCAGIMTETEFKAAIRGIAQERVSALSIALAVQRSANEYCRDKLDYLWQLVDEVEPKIRRAYRQYQGICFGVSVQKGGQWVE